MNTPTAIASSKVTTTEKEQFWKEHAKRQRESGLSIVAYCRKHQLNYDQFGYWRQKWRQQTAASRLLPVHLNQTPKIADSSRSDTLCTLVFKNGHELKVHDKSVFPMLLSVWG
jgi:transposase-like protein